jgi:hypothetical protein
VVARTETLYAVTGRLAPTVPLQVGVVLDDYYGDGFQSGCNGTSSDDGSGDDDGGGAGLHIFPTDRYRPRMSP